MLDDLSIIRVEQTFDEIVKQKFFSKVSINNRKRRNEYMKKKFKTG